MPLSSINRVLFSRRDHGFRGLAAVCLAAALGGCQKSDILVYSIPKEKPPVTARGHGAGEFSLPPMKWSLPAGWLEKPPGKMRVATFAIPGANGQDAEVAIIPLPGMTGRDVEVVNIWRESLKLAPVKPEELSALAQAVEIGGDHGRLFDMASQEPLIDQQNAARITVAIIDRDGIAWFFKMAGEAGLVAEHRPAFLEFLKSIAFEAGAEISMNRALTEPGADATKDPMLPAWEVPSGWQAQAPSPMILAKFLVPGQEGAQAEVTVSQFPGAVGGLLANVNRWRGQVGLDPLSEQDLPSVTTALEIGGGAATLVDLAGQDPKTGKKARLIGVVVPKPGRTWFYKLFGNDVAAEREKAAFIKFIQSVRYPNA